MSLFRDSIGRKSIQNEVSVDAISGGSGASGPTIYTGDGSVDSSTTRTVTVSPNSSLIFSSTGFGAVTIDSFTGLFNIGSGMLFKVEGAATKGAILAGTNSKISLHSPGTNGYILKADSTQTHGIDWVSPSSVFTIPDPLTIGRVNVKDLRPNTGLSDYIVMSGNIALTGEATGLSSIESLAFGVSALAGATGTTSQCTAVGTKALETCTGLHNTGLGYQSGALLTTGVRNVLIGSRGEVKAGNVDNSTSVGYLTRVGLNGVAVGYLADADTNSTVVGAEAYAHVAQAACIGYQCKMDSLAVGSVAIGYNILMDVPNVIVLGKDITSLADRSLIEGSFQIQRKTLAPPVSSTARFWNQIFSDASWQAGGLTVANIDNDGNIVRGTGVGNIYTANGTITANRTVAGGGFNLTFTGISTLNFSSTSLDITATNFTVGGVATKGNLLAGNNSSYVALTVGTNGKVLTADSSAATGVSWQTPAADVNIYNSDGLLPASPTIRVISGGEAAGYGVGTLSFLKTADVRLFITTTSANTNGVEIGDASDVAKRVSLYYSTTGNRSASLAADLTKTMLTGVDLATTPYLSIGNNFSYLDIVTTNGLKLGGAAAKGSLLAGTGTYYQALGVGTNGQVLTADSTVGQGVKWATPATDINIYNSDGTLTGNRTITGATFDITFNNGNFVLGTSNKQLKIQGALDVMSIGHDGTEGTFVISRSVSGSQQLVLMPTSTVCSLQMGGSSTTDMIILPKTGNTTANLALQSGSSGKIQFTTSGFTYNGAAAKGSILGVGNATVYSPFTVGSNGQILMADSTAGQGLKWATVGTDITGAPSYGEYYVSNNTTQTSLSVGVYAKMDLTGTQSGLNSSDWTVTTSGTGNRITYSGSTTRKFMLTAAISGYTASGAKRISCVFAKNGTTITSREQEELFEDANKHASVTLAIFADVANGDYYELWVANITDSQNFIGSDCSVLVRNIT